jgi:hypothetical protein
MVLINTGPPAALTAFHVYMQDTPPTSPAVGNFWWDSTGGQLYIFYNDGDSTQWVIANNTESTPITITDGGTGATTAAQAVVNLGAAPIDSPAFTGTPTAPTPPAGDTSNRIATMAAIVNSVAGVQSFNGRTGPVLLTSSDITGAGGATAAQLGAYLPLVGGTVTGNLGVSGTAYLGAGNFTVAPNGALTSNSGILATGTIQSNANLVAEGGTVFAGDSSAACYLQSSGSTRILSYWPNYYWFFNGANGYLTYTANAATAINISPSGNLNAVGGLTCGAWGVVYSNYAGNQIAFQWVSGNLRALVDNTNQGLIYTSVHPPPSDARLKDLIGEYRDGLAELIKLQPMRYKWNARGDPRDVDGKERVGLVAQDVEATGAVPFALDKRHGIIDGAEVDDFMGLDPMQLIWPMLNALKEIDARLAKLESPQWD